MRQYSYIHQQRLQSPTSLFKGAKSNLEGTALLSESNENLQQESFKRGDSIPSHAETTIAPQTSLGKNQFIVAATVHMADTAEVQ